MLEHAGWVHVLSAHLGGDFKTVIPVLARVACGTLCKRGTCVSMHNSTPAAPAPKPLASRVQVTYRVSFQATAGAPILVVVSNSVCSHHFRLEAAYFADTLQLPHLQWRSACRHGEQHVASSCSLGLRTFRMRLSSCNRFGASCLILLV